MPPKPDPERLRAVEAYLRRGWTVIPLCWPTARGTCGCGRGHEGRDIGKAPLTTSNGEVRRFPPARMDEALAFWSRVPANIGISLKESGLVVVDFDEGTPTGWERWVRTSRGGHVYMRRGSLPAANTRAVLEGQTIEVRANGYVAAPPSVHVSGHRYAWVGGAPEVYDPPEPVIEALKARQTDVEHALAEDLPDRLPKVRIEDLALPDWLTYLILMGQAPEGMRQYPSRSEAEMAAIVGLVKHTDLSDAEIAGILLNPKYRISEKPLQRRSLKVLMAEIRKARERAEKSSPPESREPSTQPTEQASESESLMAKYRLVFVKVSGLTRLDMTWVVDRLIPAYSMTSIVGASRAGKSRLARHLIAALMEGSEFLGHKVTRPLKVLYVVHRREAMNNELMDHFKRLGCDPTIVGYVPKEGMVTLPSSVPIGEEFIDTLLEGLRKEPHDVVILDTMGRWFYTKDVDESSHVSMAVMANQLSRLADEVNCLINIVHANRKDEHSNASTAVPGADTHVGAYQAVLYLSARRDGETDLILYNTLSVDLRGAEPPPKMYLLYDSETARFRAVSKEEAVSKAAGEDVRREAIREYLLTRGASSRREIVLMMAERYGMKEPTVDRILRRMKDDGEVVTIGRGRNTLYDLNRVRAVNLERRSGNEGGL